MRTVAPPPPAALDRFGGECSAKPPNCADIAETRRYRRALVEEVRISRAPETQRRPGIRRNGDARPSESLVRAGCL
ncbi:hypothetical protein CZ774_07690 [Frigoribacterium sp. JB110]|nr:hypothetical protein CZ774_07690 [Frigoribacterium sp. JB110]